MKDTLCRFGIRRLAAPVLVMLLAIHAAPERAAASTPAEAGYRDFSYGTAITPAPTGEKPESKLWWNDGAWWGVLWSVAAGSNQIHRLDLPSQSWVSTGIAVDSRPGSKCDVLWTAGQLYVVSHIFSTSPGAVSAANSGRLYRYRYDSGSRSYALDSGFPVLVNRSKSETLVLDRDSAGKLWVTWMEAGRVKINASSGDDRTWGEPFDLPVQGNDTQWDDISSVVAMDGRIGIMWSNQADERMYFAVHVDGNANGDWEPRENALADAALGAVADDHINLKYSCAGDGALYGAVKTSLTGSQPGIYLLKRSGSGTWTRHVVGTISEGHTRPLVLLKQDENRVYVFAMSTLPGADDRQVIYMKSASMSDLQFPSGLGTPFIQSSLDVLVNDPTGTKQCLDATMGIAVLASARDTRFYLHQAVSGGTPPPPPGTLVFPPTHDAKVVSSFPTRNFGADPSLQVRAGDPAYTSYLKFQVTGISGPAQRAHLRIFCTDASVEGGRVHSVSNSYRGATTSWVESGLTWSNAPTISGSPLDQKGSVTLGSWVEFDVTSAITGDGTYSFGLVTSSTNSAIYSSTEGSQPPELRVQAGTSPPPPGPVAYEQGSTGGSVNASTVSTAGTFSQPGFYIAAISSRPRVTAVSVSGLGLTWSLVKSQCSGRNQTGVEIWRAQGTPTSSGVVTARYASAPSSAVISVSRYSGAASIGAVVSGNTTGTGGACSGGADNASYSLPLSVSSSGAVAFGAVAMRQRAHVPGSGFTERAEIAAGSGGSVAGLAVEDGAIPPVQGVNVAGTFNGIVDWAAVGLVILTSGTAPSGSVEPQVAVQETSPNEAIRLSNHPNPTRGETRIHYGIGHPGSVRLEIHDVAGRLVSVLTDEVHRAGTHTRAWDGRDSQGRTLSRGVYFCRMETATQRKTIKIVLVR